MDLSLDSLLNLPNTTVESFTEEENKIILNLRFLHDEVVCPHCNMQSGKLKQNRPILIRDLSVFGKVVYLNTPRRQFYCQHCQKHFTEKLPFVDWERRYTQRYEEYVYQRVQSASVEQISRDELSNHFYNIASKLLVTENYSEEICYQRLLNVVSELSDRSTVCYPIPIPEILSLPPVHPNLGGRDIRKPTFGEQMMSKAYKIKSKVKKLLWK